MDTGSVVEYLKIDSAHGSQTKRLLILPDGITVQNLERALTREEIKTEAIPTIIDDLAHSILFPNGQRGRIVEPDILGQMVIQEVGHLPKLHSLLSNEAALEIFVDEFDQYLRCTEAGDLRPELDAAAKKITDEFASNRSATSVDLFQLLESKLLAKIPTSSPPIFLSRTHLVRKAREAIETSWPSVLDVDEVLLASISVFDAPTLRFLVRISELGTARNSSFRLRFFLGPGTEGIFRARLQELGAATEDAKGPATPSGWTLLGSHFGQGKMKFIETPERRREVEELAKELRDLLLSGTPPSNILVAARTSGKYLQLIDEIFSAYAIPYHVQTRRPYAYTSAYRFVKAALDLLVKASSSDITWKDITDPLRLGFCLSFSQGKWPVPSIAFTYLEERLSGIEHRKGGPPRTLANWTVAATTLSWKYPQSMLTKFLDWVNQQIKNAPTSAKDARNLISTMLGNYMFQVSVHSEKSLSPRAISPGRFVLYDDHYTRTASEIRGELGRVESYINDSMSMLGQTPDWNLVSRAFGEVFGGESYGLAEKDLSAIRIVDVGNASFYKTDVLVLVGMQVDEFPRKNPDSTFLPDQLREALDVPSEGKAAYLYLRSAANDYANEVDFLDLALQSGPSKVICSMSYLDEEGRTVDWSPFVSILGPLGAAVRRVSPDNWLPIPTPGQSWSQVANDSPPWARERLYCFHSNRRFPQLSPQIDLTGLKQVASSLDPTEFTVHLSPRVERYLRPPEYATVEASEPWFAGFPLSTIVGSPLRTHELDLHATCPLQFYFYQFMFLWRGNSIDRDTIPTYSKKPHWKYGRLPRRLSHLYPSSKTEVSVIQAVLGKFPNRQPDLTSVSSQSALRATLASVLNEYGFSQFGKVVDDEWSLAKQEVADKVARNWAWVKSDPSATLTLSGGVSVVIPSHRVDTLQGPKLVLTYVSFSGQVESEKRGVYYENDEVRNIHDPLRDHRIPTLLLHYSKAGKVAGGLYSEFYSGERKGYYHHDWLSKHKGATGYREELAMPYRSSDDSRKQVYEKGDWTTLLTQFDNSIQRRAVAMVPNPDITFQGEVREVHCNDCVYKDLCQLPRARGF